MPTLTRRPTMGDLVKWHPNLDYTTEVVTLAAGANLALGAVLALNTTTGQFVPADASAAAANGIGVPSAVLLADTDATAGPKSALVLKRGPAIVADAMLVYAANVDTAPKKALVNAALTDKTGIVIRRAV